MCLGKSTLKIQHVWIHSIYFLKNNTRIVRNLTYYLLVQTWCCPRKVSANSKTTRWKTRQLSEVVRIIQKYQRTFSVLVKILSCLSCFIYELKCILYLAFKILKCTQRTVRYVFHLKENIIKAWRGVQPRNNILCYYNMWCPHSFFFFFSHPVTI